MSIVSCDKTFEYKTISASYTLPAGYKIVASIAVLFENGTHGKCVTFNHPNRMPITLTMPVNSKIQFEDDTESDPYGAYKAYQYELPPITTTVGPKDIMTAKFIAAKEAHAKAVAEEEQKWAKKLSVFPGQIMDAWIDPATGQDFELVMSKSRTPEVVKRIPVPDKTPVVTLPTGRRFRSEE